MKEIYEIMIIEIIISITMKLGLVTSIMVNKNVSAKVKVLLSK